MPQSPQDQKAIVQRMIDAGESEENIATVIQHFKGQEPEKPKTYSTLGTIGELAKLFYQTQSGGRTPRQDAETVTNALPMIEGGVGGAVGLAGGIPGSVAGAMIGGGAGEAHKQLINRFVLGKGGPTTPTDAANQIATQGAVQGAAELGGKGVAMAAKYAAPIIMQSAIKPGIKATARAIGRGVEPENLPIVKTLLNEGVNVSPGGIEKLNKIITASNKEIKNALAAVPEGRVYPEAVAARTEALKESVGPAHQVNPLSDVAAVQGAQDEFLATHRGMPVGHEGPARPLTLQEAQQMKIGTYESLGKKAYGELKAPAIEAQKALARGLKEDIAAEAKASGIDINIPNAREGAAITTKEAVAKRIAAAGNRDPVALAWLAHNPTAGLLFILERSPAIKSMLARGLYQSAAKTAGVPENLIRLMVASVVQADQQEPQ